MGRKKTIPVQKLDQEVSEYLGIYGHLASQANSLQQKRKAVSDWENEGSSVVEEETLEQEIPTQQSVKKVEFSVDSFTCYESTIPEIVFITKYSSDPDLNLGQNDATEDEQLTEDVEAEDTTRILLYNYDPRREPKDEDVTAKILLGQIPLDPSFRLESTAPQSEDGESEPPKLPFRVRSVEGAMELLQLGQLLETRNIGKAVELGLMVLTINWTKENSSDESEEGHYSITLSLSDYAFDICNPRIIPVHERRNSKDFKAGLTLQRAFAELIPKDSVMFPLASQRSDNELITAKQVYQWVDNLQIKAFRNKKQAEQIGSLNIPGLLPTLRPYQEAAVSWMLMREEESESNSSSRSGAEWELAWVVLECKNGKWTVSFLPEYAQASAESTGTSVSGQYFLFCPFMNWLATSVEEAREMARRTAIDPKDRKLHHGEARGGILAESMGLGKSVELLACILKHQDPSHIQVVPTLNQTLINETVPDDDEKPSSDSKKIKRRRIQRDQASSSSTSSSSEDRAFLPEELDSKSIDNSAIISLPSSLEECWLDLEDSDLGSCICGENISIQSSLKKDSIVICERCREPMHRKCAVHSPEPEKLNQMNGVKFNIKFSRKSFSCRFCPQSYCPCCVANKIAMGKENKIRSRATVIVTPPAILNQWKREISRHTTGLKVVEYFGVQTLCSRQKGRRASTENFHLIHPRWLADVDIVLMTFDALMQDLGHSDSNPFAGAKGRSSLRKRKRYRVVPSPLSSIRWWRVCLDEAQRVETPTAGSAQMALKLDTSLRWCVTGTPIGKGKLEDLFGLLLFLRSTPPFSNKHWFRNTFSSFGSDVFMEKRLKHLLRSVFWRSTRSLKSVEEEMGVPPQEVKISLLKFSSVEKHFYNCQLEETLDVVCDLNNKQKLSQKRRKNDKSLDQLDRQLGKLRAACCHPQVGSSGLALGKRARGKGAESSVRVLTMDQVLDRLIDDARNKCEEALRVALFHSNPMATLTRLKVEARSINPDLAETIRGRDEYLLAQSCKLYDEALGLADKNAEPTLVTEEVWLKGSEGFRSPHKSVRGGLIALGWNVQSPNQAPKDTQAKLWATCEFACTGKRMRQIRVRALSELPIDLQEPSQPENPSFSLLHPRRCALQVSSAAAGGEFVDVLTFELPLHENGHDHDSDWIVVGGRGLWVYKSKTWRVVIETFHNKWMDGKACYCGVQMELYEPAVGIDTLPRLHTLHNAIVSFRQLQNFAREEDTAPSGIKQNQNQQTTTARKSTSQEYLELSKQDIEDRVRQMEEEYAKIETISLEYSKSVRQERSRRLKALISSRKGLESDLRRLWSQKITGFWDVNWWEDIIAAVSTQGTPAEKSSLCAAVQEAVDGCDTYEENFAFDKGAKPMEFPRFDSIDGLAVAIRIRFEDFLEKMQNGRYDKCINSVFTLSTNPNDGEVLENQICGVCKADWGRTGPKCRHCVVGDKLRVLDMNSQKLARHVLRSIWTWAKSSRSGIRNSETVLSSVEIAAKFFEILEFSGKEALAASSLWIAHLNLLNSMDELSSTKTPMRLLLDGEDVSNLTEDERNAVVYSHEVCAKYFEHETKQATALANLRQLKSTLQYLKNQAKKTETCIICQSGFSTDRALLKCGHSFHVDCFKWLQKKQKSSSHVCCPFRCKTRTHFDEVLIATDRATDDGSKGGVVVKGDFGTKVNAIVGDLLAAADGGEKSVVFSMWEDMLDIIQEALIANDLKFVRASSRSKIGESTKHFRSADCFVLLLNVKNGAEGLNLIEATGVYMVEPLLNFGLDSQAIARINRIGQTRKTTVHRYIIEGTIEEKIDLYRKQHQEDQLEDAIVDSRKCAIHAGGIDGGFASKEELMDMLSPCKSPVSSPIKNKKETSMEARSVEC